MIAALYNDNVACELLASKVSNYSINIVDESQYTVLIFAVLSNLLALTNHLLTRMERKIINLSNNDGNTALIFAAKKGHTEICKSLISVMPLEIINKFNNNNQTALQQATENGQIAVVKILLEYGATIMLESSIPIENNGEEICIKLCQAAKCADEIYNNSSIFNSNQALNQEMRETFVLRLKFHLINYGAKEKDNILLDKVKPLLSKKLVNELEDFLIKPKLELYLYEADIVATVENISPVPLLLLLKSKNIGNHWLDKLQQKNYFTKYSKFYPEATELMNKAFEATLNEDEIKNLIEILENHQGRYFEIISMEDIIRYIPGHEKVIEDLTNMILPTLVKIKFEEAIDQYNKAEGDDKKNYGNNDYNALLAGSSPEESTTI